MYKVGNRFIEIHRDVVVNLEQWNADPERHDASMDFRFAMAIYLSLVPSQQISSGEIDQNAMDFVSGNFNSSDLF